MGTARGPWCHIAVRLAILLALWPALARADLPTIDDAFPPTIRVGQGPGSGCRILVDRARLDTTGAPLSWLVVEISSKRECRSAELELDLPAGTHVVGMAVHSRGERSWSATRPRREARQAFEQEAGAALLQWESTSADQDHLRVSIPMPARVELALELPPLAHVVLAAKERTDVDLRGVAARTTPASYAHADAETALVAGAPNRDEPLRSSGRWSRAPHGGSDKTGIRHAMKRDRARITYCYERVAQWRGEIEGAATLQFFIGASGAVERVTTVETELPATVTGCIEDVIRQWRFEGVESAILVNYPLRFSTPRY